MYFLWYIILKCSNMLVVLFVNLFNFCFWFVFIVSFSWFDEPSKYRIYSTSCMCVIRQFVFFFFLHQISINIYNIYSYVVFLFTFFWLNLYVLIYFGKKIIVIFFFIIIIIINICFYFM